MNTRTEKTSFGSITIDGRIFRHDVIIRRDGTVHKRKKKLSKKYYGTSHRISREEAEYILEPGVKTVLIGTGQYDQVTLSDEARTFFEGQGVTLMAAATPEAIGLWNELQGPAIALFHVTC